MNFFLSKPKTAVGFTVMELMISVGIFLLITALVIVNFRQGQYRDELAEGANVLETAFREMQTQATAGKTVQCLAFPTIPSEPPGGWGVNIDTSAGNYVITVFADCLEDETDLANHVYNQNIDLVLNTLTLPSRVKITGLTVFDINNTGRPLLNDVNGLNIAFSPLTELVWLQGKNPTDPESYIKARVELTHTVLQQRILVEVNALTGQVTAGDITILGL